MRFPVSGWSAYAALSMAAMVACLAVFMCFQRLDTGPQVSTILPVAHVPGASHGDDESNSHPTKNGYLPVPTEETEAGDKNPVNAYLLTALLSVVFMGVALGVVFGGKLLRRILVLQANGERPPPPFDRPSPQRPAAPLLSVFRL